MSKHARRNAIFFLIFVAPTLFIFTTVMLVPFFYGLLLSFSNSNGVSTAMNMVGFHNYWVVVHNTEFWSSLWLTVKYVAACVIFTNLFAFLIAYLLSLGLKGRNFLRAAFFTPNLLGGIVLGLIWRFVFQDVLVYVGGTLHIALFSQSWLADPNKALLSLIVVTVWQLSGYMMVIYVAGFTSISHEVLEAADIDGCNAFQRLLRVEAPLMVPSFIICSFLSLSRSFMMYDINISLTNGDPFNSTVLISLNIFREAFDNYKYGTAQAEAFFLFFMVALVSVAQVQLGKRMEVEQ